MMSTTVKETQSNYNIERFVPQGSASLVEDAPGWGSVILSPTSTSNTGTTTDTLEDGPICWKCRGSGKRPQKSHGPSQRKNDAKTDDSETVTIAAALPPPTKKVACPVCHGKGRLAAKLAQVQAAHQPGVIRKSRRINNHSQSPHSGEEEATAATAESSGIVAFALRDNMDSSHKTSYWTNQVRKADQGLQDVVVEIKETAQEKGNDQYPVWLPRKGEELCKLNGTWRILQRVGGHRWTTDDLITAYVAVREIQQQRQQQNGEPKTDSGAAMRYLDLGTGNASVLQMTLRALLQDNVHVVATGIEARSEAVHLARRSLQFNVGPDFPVAIVHGDFRDVVGYSALGLLDERKSTATTSTTYDLVTGTPPYFRVDFKVVQNSQNQQQQQHDQDLMVTSAVIRQGGMPTARQSAPARCEFRGGIEAYCQAASKVLTCDTGRFVVCENYLNHKRVLTSLQEAGLRLLRLVKVEGKQGRGPLFCVYVAMKPAIPGSSATSAVSAAVVEEELLTVRDKDGNWTNEYSQNVFATMNIPQSVRLESDALR